MTAKELINYLKTVDENAEIAVVDIVRSVEGAIYETSLL